MSASPHGPTKSTSLHRRPTANGHPSPRAHGRPPPKRSLQQHRAHPICALLFVFVALCTAPSQQAAAAPRLQITPSQVDLFPTLAGAAQTATTTVTLRNEGDSPLTLWGAALTVESAGFVINPAGPTFSPGELLAPGAQRTLAVAYSGDPRRRQAYGALQVFSDDPRGQDDPRTDTHESIIAIPLCAGSSLWLLWLWLLPLSLGIVLHLRGAVAARRRAASLMDRRAAIVAVCATGLLSLLAVLRTLHDFAIGFGARDGAYGFQHLWQRTLRPLPAWPIDIRLGIDGLSGTLLVGATLWGGFALVWPAISSERRARCQPGEPSSGAGSVDAPIACWAWRACVWAALIGTLTSLDLRSFAVHYGLGLYAMSKLVPPALRRHFARVAAAAWLFLSAGLALLWSHAQPWVRSDGTFTRHSGDLVNLSYQNYFADVPLWGLPHAGAAVAFGCLLLAALLPLAALLWLCAARDVRCSSRALLCVAPAALLAYYLIVRVAAGALPALHVATAPAVAALAVLPLMPLALWRSASPWHLLVLLCATAPVAGAILGLASRTETGLQAAHLHLLLLCVTAPWLGQAIAPPVRPPQPCEDQAPRIAALLALPFPGSLASIAHVLVAIAAAAPLRGLSLLYVTAMLLATAHGLLRLFSLSPATAPKPSSPRLAQTRTSNARAFAVPSGRTLGSILLLGQLLLCFCLGPLFEFGHTWVHDFISHTGDHSGPSLIARRAASPSLTAAHHAHHVERPASPRANTVGLLSVATR